MILLICLLITLAILIKSYIFLIIFVPLIFIYIFYRYRKRLIYLIFLFLIFLLLPLKTSSSCIDEEINDTFIVVECKTNYSIVKNKFDKFVIYENLNYLDIIYIEGKLEDINGFDLDNRVSSFKDYLNNKGVYNSIKIDTFSYKIKSPIKNYINHSETASKYLDYIVFNHNNIDKSFYNALKVCLLLPMFVVSGLHINILNNLLKKYLKPKFIFIIIFIYLLFLNFQIPALRAYLMLLFSYFNDKYQLKIAKFDIFLIVYLVFIFFNPLIIYNMSFILTFLCSFILFFIDENKFYTTVIINATILPLILFMNKEINILAIFISLAFSFIFKYLYLFSFFVYFIPFLDIFYENIMLFLVKLIEFINGSSVNFIIGNMSIIILIIYYIILLIIILKRELKLKVINELILLFCILLSLSYRTIIFNYQFVSFIDIGQGNCTIIVDKNNVTLIDTGGLKYEDLASTRIIPYLKSYGIKHIDNIIISHKDYDHYGALESLQKNIKVKKVYYSYEYEELFINNIYMKNLNYNKDYIGEDNNESGVMYFEFIDYQFLIMGDATKENEAEIISKYNINCDYLLIGHHGSNTSSSYDFLKAVNPNLAIISCGKNNRYGHPHKEVIDNLNRLGITYYRIDESGTLEISHNNFYKKVFS